MYVAELIILGFRALLEILRPNGIAPWVFCTKIGWNSSRVDAYCLFNQSGRSYEIHFGCILVYLIHDGIPNSQSLVLLFLFQAEPFAALIVIAVPGSTDIIRCIADKPFVDKVTG